jgi:imidazolonepropionase-like amidohydrolase
MWRAVRLASHDCFFELRKFTSETPGDRPAHMKTSLALALGTVAIAGSLVAAAQHPRTPQDSGVVAFTNVNVVPMDTERVLEGHTVLVRNGRIAAVGGPELGIPAEATRIDGTGKYLMPGLAEMHGHMPGGAIEETVMFLYVANGITTVRGMLGEDQHLALRERANSGQIVAPTLYMAGPSFNGGSVNSPLEAEAKVRLQKAQGWDLLKIHPGLTVPEYDALAMTAHEVGIRFGGHVPAEVGITRAIEMGQETFDHLDGFIEYLDAFDKPIDQERLQDLISLVKGANAWVVPTMVLWDVGIIGHGDAEEMSSYPENRYWYKTGGGNSVQGWANRQRTAAAGMPDSADLWAANRERVLKALSDAGAGILMGTDSPQIFSVPGFSLHREMQAMSEAGMSTFDILVSGTRAVGEYFQRNDTFGTVAVGRRADLILLNSNPLEDVVNVADRAGVMVRGRWISEADIQARLAEIEAQFN